MKSMTGRTEKNKEFIVCMGFRRWTQPINLCYRLHCYVLPRARDGNLHGPRRQRNSINLHLHFYIFHVTLNWPYVWAVNTWKSRVFPGSLLRGFLPRSEQSSPLRSLCIKRKLLEVFPILVILSAFNLVLLCPEMGLFAEYIRAVLHSIERGRNNPIFPCVTKSILFGVGTSDKERRASGVKMSLTYYLHISVAWNSTFSPQISGIYIIFSAWA